MRRGLFITFEGLDGTGKSTQITQLAEYFQQQGYPVTCTREPGGTEIGEQIRHVLHDVANTDMAAQAEILLYSASRAQLVGQLIQPRLEAGDVVICDRYADSTYAYQGYGRELDLGMLQTITTFATQGLKPDITIWLDMSVEDALQRRHQAGQNSQGEWNRMDQQTLDFYERVRQGYTMMARAEPKRWLAIDAAHPVAVVHQAIRHQLEGYLTQIHT